MALRYTQTEKWQQVLFRRLTPEAKLLYLYILDSCDIAGIWRSDIDMVAFETGLRSDEQLKTLFERGVESRQSIESSLVELEPFLIAPSKGLDRGLEGATKGIFVFYVKGFLGFQKNLPLNGSNNCHRGILELIGNSNGLQEHILRDIKEMENQRGLVAPLKPLKRGYGNSNSNGNGNKGGVGEKRTAAELAADYAAQQAALQETKP